MATIYKKIRRRLFEKEELCLFKPVFFVEEGLHKNKYFLERVSVNQNRRELLKRKSYACGILFRKR